MSTAPPTFTWTLGDRLRKARDMAGLSQQELARRLHLSRNTIAAYERTTGDSEETIPNRWLLRAWAEVCGIGYDRLEVPDPPTPGGHGSTVATDGYLPVRALIAA